MKRRSGYLTGGSHAPHTSVDGPSATLPAWAYTCPELGRTCMRPGAYDAFDLPSLFNGRRHYPRPNVNRATLPLIVAAVDVSADRLAVTITEHAAEAA